MAPLSRRKFSSGAIKPHLVDQVTATLSVAKDLGAAVIGLNHALMRYLNGSANARLCDRVEGDVTHLDLARGMVFGNMVAGLIVRSNIRRKLRNM